MFVAWSGLYNSDHGMCGNIFSAGKRMGTSWLVIFELWSLDLKPLNMFKSSCDWTVQVKMHMFYLMHCLDLLSPWTGVVSAMHTKHLKHLSAGSRGRILSVVVLPTCLCYLSLLALSLVIIVYAISFFFCWFVQYCVSYM